MMMTENKPGKISFNLSKDSKLPAKILKVMEEVSYIQKQGYNDFHKYRYAKEADVVASLRKSFIANGIIAITSIIDKQITPYTTRAGKTSFLTSILLDIYFMDVSNGDYIKMCVAGDGADTDDKGVYKAITGAHKYALLKTFLLPTGDDPEVPRKDERVSRTTTGALAALPSQLKEIKEIMKQKNIQPEGIRDFIKNNDFEGQEFKTLTQSDAKKILAYLIEQEDVPQ